MVAMAARVETAKLTTVSTHPIEGSFVFVAIRDIRFAKGRFTLMGSVVMLITMLIVLLSGLTAGLANESTSGIKNLPATHIAFGASGQQAPKQSFSDSSVDPAQLRTWSEADGVQWADPLGIARTRLRLPDASTSSVTVFGARPGDHIAPTGLGAGSVVISSALAEEKNLGKGDTVGLGAGELTVAGIADDAYYSHTPVVWTSLKNWQQLPTAPTADGRHAVATVIAAEVDDTTETGTLDDRAHTTSATTSASLSAIGSFSSENSSLLTMQGFLYAISALVIGAFLTVWTIQRTGDIAILKALGGSTGYLLRDALAQSLIVLLVGAGAGGVVGVGIGALAVGTVPFALTVTTTVVPVAAMIVLGMCGAALAVRRITAVDPLTALGGNR